MGIQMSVRTPLSQPTKVITNEQRKQYFRDEFLVLPEFVSQQWLEKLRSVTDEFVEKSRHISDSDAQ